MLKKHIQCKTITTTISFLEAWGGGGGWGGSGDRSLFSPCEVLRPLGAVTLGSPLPGFDPALPEECDPQSDCSVHESLGIVGRLLLLRQHKLEATVSLPNACFLFLLYFCQQSFTFCFFPTHAQHLLNLSWTLSPGVCTHIIPSLLFALPSFKHPALCTLKGYGLGFVHWQSHCASVYSDNSYNKGLSVCNCLMVEFMFKNLKQPSNYELSSHTQYPAR